MDTIARDLQNLRGGDRSGVVGHAGNFTREGGGVQSVARALTLLEIIADLGGEASLTDIAGRAGLNVSTCHHLLSTLVTKGYAARVDNRRSYALGARVLYLSQIRLLQVDLPRRAAPWIERANAATGEKIHLAFLQGNNVVKLVNRYARDAVALKSPSRDRTDAAHATATGKAILAWLSQDYLQRIVAEHGMKSFTTKTITDLETSEPRIGASSMRRICDGQGGVLVRRHLSGGCNSRSYGCCARGVGGFVARSPRNRRTSRPATRGNHVGGARIIGGTRRSALLIVCRRCRRADAAVERKRLFVEHRLDRRASSLLVDAMAIERIARFRPNQLDIPLHLQRLELVVMVEPDVRANHFE